MCRAWFTSSVITIWWGTVLTTCWICAASIVGNSSFVHGTMHVGSRARSPSCCVAVCAFFSAATSRSASAARDSRSAITLRRATLSLDCSRSWAACVSTVLHNFTLPLDTWIFAGFLPAGLRRFVVASESLSELDATSSTCWLLPFRFLLRCWDVGTLGRRDVARRDVATACGEVASFGSELSEVESSQSDVATTLCLLVPFFPTWPLLKLGLGGGAVVGNLH